MLTRGELILYAIIYAVVGVVWFLAVRAERKAFAAARELDAMLAAREAAPKPADDERVNRSEGAA